MENLANNLRSPLKEVEEPKFCYKWEALGVFRHCLSGCRGGGGLLSSLFLSIVENSDVCDDEIDI